jgi:hypothetical protein
MSSPFQEKFSAKSPFGKKGVVTLSEEDLKKIKSASSEPAKEISYEGQGGKDYENRPEDAINPEGQGGIDYESEDYKKKTESPLGSYANPAGMQYVSNKADFQRLQNDIVSGYKASKGKDKQKEKNLFPSMSNQDYSVGYEFKPKSYINKSKP